MSASATKQTTMPAGQLLNATPPTVPPRANEADLPLLEFSCRLIKQPDEMLEHLAAWHRLAEVALEPNVFHEAFFLLPAWRHLAEQQNLELLLIEAPKRVYPAGPRVLCGVFPLIKRRLARAICVWELWRHPYCFLGTPLLRRDCAREVLDQFLAFAKDSAAAVVHLPLVTGDGPFHRLLIDSLHDQQRACFIKDQHTRAQFTRASDAESFLKACLSRKKRQGIQRMERRLAEQGRVETDWFAPPENLSSWMDDFLQLESAGWKGTQKTALASQPRHAAFFRQMVKQAAAVNKLQLGRLNFNGRPLAMICNLLAEDGGYSFKIAYDEGFAQHSPGLLLELALIRHLHEQNIHWMDSCATAEHSMINPLWPDRGIRQSWWISTGSAGGNLAVAGLPLARWFKQCWRRSRAKVPAASPSLSASDESPATE